VRFRPVRFACGHTAFSARATGETKRRVECFSDFLSVKCQAPSPKLQATPKFQLPKRLMKIGGWRLGVRWDWDLGLGI
jgi:hypothetical protein